MKKQIKTLKKGFTLTEILVVVLIMAVMAAVVYPLYTKAITKSRAVEAINLLEMVRNKQIQKYARDTQYYKEFPSMGQLTGNLANETPINGGAQLQVRDYTLSLNNNSNCMSAKYEKGSSTFTFSTSYETAGLGCTGSICSSFGDIIGDAKTVCNCGGKKCPDSFNLNEDTCGCDCLLSCSQDGKCFDKYGGGLTRACSSGCGTENSIDSCNGSIWSGKCWSATQKLPLSQSCGWNNSGTQTRSCKASCDKGLCGAWGPCKNQQCNPAEKPAERQPCGKNNTGTQTRNVSCNTDTGMWEAAAWGGCSGQVCAEDEKPLLQQSCGKCGTQSRTTNCDSGSGIWSAPSDWGACKGEGVCMPGTTQSCGGIGIQTCNENCGWSSCSCGADYTWDSVASSCKCTKTCDAGASSCPPGELCTTSIAMVLNAETCQCEPAIPTIACPDGFSVEDGACVCNKICESAPPVCVPNGPCTVSLPQVLNAETCQCEYSQPTTSTTCSPGQTMQDGECVCSNTCPPGYFLDSNCECIPPVCTANKHWDSSRGECVCSAVTTLPNRTTDDNCNFVCASRACAPGDTFNESDCMCYQKVNRWREQDRRTLSAKAVYSCNYGCSSVGTSCSVSDSLYGGFAGGSISGLENIKTIYGNYKNCPEDTYYTSCTLGEYCRAEYNPCPAAKPGDPIYTTTTGGGALSGRVGQCQMEFSCAYSVDKGGSIGIGSSMMPCGGGDPGCSPSDRYYVIRREVPLDASVALMHCESSAGGNNYYPGQTVPGTTTGTVSTGTTTPSSTGW